ncbi:MAG: hypothetical protein GY767_20270, partial [Shimia sp.]|nr:hypothetical protein [Shimia sp.]
MVETHTPPNHCCVGTILATVTHMGPRWYATKTLRSDGPGVLRWTKKSPSFWDAHLLTAYDLDSLVEVYTRTLADPYKAITRSTLIPGAQTQGIERKSRKNHADGLFIDTPSNMLLLDIDEVPQWLELDTHKPEESVNELMAFLEKTSPTFKAMSDGVSFGFMLSSTAGLKKFKRDDKGASYRHCRGAFKVHLLFWLLSPTKGAQGAIWAKQVNKEVGFDVLDLAPFNTAQRMTGPPVLLDGASIDIPQRHGIIRRQHDASNWTAPTLPKLTPAPSTKPTQRQGHIKEWSDQGRRFLQAMLKRDCDDLVGLEDGDKRGKQIYRKALRWAWRYRQEDCGAVLGSLESVGDRIIQAGIQGAGLSKTDARRPWKNGSESGQDPKGETEFKPAHFRTAHPRQLHRQHHGKAPATVEAARKRTLKWARSYTQDIVDQSGCGVGKSYAIRQAVAKYHSDHKDHLQTIVAKDRAAALEHGRELKALGVDAVVWIGRHGTGQIMGLLGEGWHPSETDDNADTCAKDTTRGVNIVCRGCSFQTACLAAMGYQGRKAAALNTAQRGGVVIVTLDMLRAFISEYARIDNPAPWMQLWGDDAALPSAAALDVKALRNAAPTMGRCARREDEDSEVVEGHGAHMADALADLWETSGQVHPKDNKRPKSQREHIVDGAVVHKHIADAVGQGVLDDLVRISTAPGIARAIHPALKWLVEGHAARGYLVGTHGGNVRLCVHPLPLEIPTSTRVYWADATVCAVSLEAFLGRRLDVKMSHVEHSPRHKRARFKLSLSAQGVLAQTNEEFMSRANSTAAQIKKRIDAHRERLGREPNMLVITHQRIIGSNHLAAFLEVTGLKNPAIIHWRGVRQKGSNAYQDFDGVITLGDPRTNVTAYRQMRRAIALYRAQAGLPDAQ